MGPVPAYTDAMRRVIEFVIVLLVMAAVIVALASLAGRL
jgi:hypothetical protein